MDYKPIEHYGLIGNLETCALVGRDGAIDWYCVPHVESPSVFAKILDSDRGGHWTIQPTDSFESDQQYVDKTNVLQTVFNTQEQQATVTDFMPIAEHEYEHDVSHRTLFRRIRADEGPVDLNVTFAPAFDYADSTPEFQSIDTGAVATSDDTQLILEGLPSWKPSDANHGDSDDNGTDNDNGDTDAVASIGTTLSLDDGETRWLTLKHDDSDLTDAPKAILDETIAFWQDWVHDEPATSDCDFGGAWHDLVIRSELALKLLTHHDSGAIAAAPTASLPESIGGSRNWDYRYNWIRDAAFTIQALYKLGHKEEVEDYLHWVIERCHGATPSKMQPLYGLHGRADLSERNLPLDGYKHSQPVRVGNAAKDQLQFDTYGELVDAIYETSRYGKDLPSKDWPYLRDIVNFVCKTWTQKDSGIWEVRSDPSHFVYSKVMCWVAIDRGLKLVDDAGFDGPTDHWKEQRDAIKQRVLDDGYNEDKKTFVRSFDDQSSLDASNLLIPITGFLPFDDPRVQGTIDATLDQLVTTDGLVKRYDGDDGLSGDEGSFLLCSFWLIDALALSGRIDHAESMFKSVLEYASPLGLFAEEVDNKTGSQLGNFPQAFSHIGLINSALYITRTKGVVHPGPEPRGIGVSHIPDASDS